MTYAYFMALSNVSAGFLPDITGAWMFKIIKKACFQPESLIKTIPLDTWLIIFEALILAVILVLVIRQKKIWSIVLASVSLALGCYLLGPVLIAHLKSVAIYFVQQSFVTLKPFIGDADFWGREAYRALIIRYFLIISCFFMLTAIPFVYLLSRIKDKKGTAEE